MAATLNLAARLSLVGTVIRVDAKDRPASDDGRFAASRAVTVIVLTDGGGFAQVTVAEPHQDWAERSLGAGQRVEWLLDLGEGKGEFGGWSRLTFVGDLEAIASIGSPVPASKGASTAAKAS